jgi:hypothetical protein
MAVIACIAADLAALRAILPRIPNPGLVIMILVLEVGFFRMTSRRGAARTFWLGFELAGWAYVVTCEVFSWTAWRMARSVFEVYVLGRPIVSPFEMQRFILFAGAVQLLIALNLALATGTLARWLWTRWDAGRGGCARQLGSAGSGPGDRAAQPDHARRTGIAAGSC